MVLVEQLLINYYHYYSMNDRYHRYQTNLYFASDIHCVFKLIGYYRNEFDELIATLYYIGVS